MVTTALTQDEIAKKIPLLIAIHGNVEDTEHSFITFVTSTQGICKNFSCGNDVSLTFAISLLLVWSTVKRVDMLAHCA